MSATLDRSAPSRLGATGVQPGKFGLGCAPLGNLYQAMDDRAAFDMLQSAWRAGIRCYDTAPHYGQGLSERRVGDLLRRHPDQPYVLSTKVGRLLKPAGYAESRHGYQSPMPFDIHYDYSYEGVMRSFEDSLQRLGLDRIDMLFMHDLGALTHGPDHEKHFSAAISGGFQAMHSLREQNMVKAIGLGANESEVCEMALRHGDWDCFLLAGRYTLLEQEALDSFLPKCRKRGCFVIIGGPYNSGILALGSQSSREPHYNYGPAPAAVVGKVRELERICAEFTVPLGASALQFPLAHPAVACVIPGMASLAELEQFLYWSQIDIPADFWISLRDAGLLREDAPLPAGRADSCPTTGGGVR
ncbi:MAG: aldo/keto reductase [Gammaproteobacteria bacterium]|nr:aldo/keto reductase [Gammaproteobacteria bacterium]